MSQFVFGIRLVYTQRCVGGASSQWQQSEENSDRACLDFSEVHKYISTFVIAHMYDTISMYFDMFSQCLILACDLSIAWLSSKKSSKTIN